jgi:carbamoyltransferase
VHVLGVSCFFHDAAAAIVRDGDLVAAAEEERFTRKKHDYSFPAQAIDFCLGQAGIAGPDLDLVVFFEKPFVKFDRILRTTMQAFPRAGEVFRKSMLSWLTDKLWVKERIKKTLGVPDDRILFSDHHLSHAASAFLCSPFDHSAILTVDGVGEWATAAYGVGQGPEIRLLREIRFPHSLGLLYSAFTAFLGFEVNEGEYKVMGLAPFGEPRYVDRVWRLIRLADDGSFTLDMDYFSFHRSARATYSQRFVDLLGPPREPGTPFFTAASGYPPYLGARPTDHDTQARRNQHYADIAASVQRVTEEVLLAMARHVHRETGLPRLCLAGGVAFNSSANGRLLRESPFRELYVQPAAGDGGGALGAALFGYHVALGKPRRFVMRHAAWGQAHSPGDVAAFLADRRVAHTEYDHDDDLVTRVVGDLAAGKVVGWFQGRFEWGPRALGHRSILAAPWPAAMKDVVNTKIKFREPFRPFAPSVVMARASDYFDLPEPERQYPAHFMQCVVPVRADRADRIPAVTHVDGSARLQAVDPDRSPLYHRLLDAFGQATGVPVLLNTSFNLKGEPIVSSPAQAFSTFSRSGMDVLVLGRHVIGR